MLSQSHMKATVAGMGFLAMGMTAWGQIQFDEDTSARFPLPLLNEYTNQASIVDVDGDNDLDIALANGQGFSAQGAALRARLFINNGSGVFTEESATRLGSWMGWARGVEFGDCDDDGDWDMVLAQDFAKQPQLFVNNGSGTFTNVTATQLPVGLLSSSRAQFGDVDNDGDLDLAFCNSPRNGTGQPKLYMNDGTGVYTDGTVGHFPIGNVNDQMDLIFGDVDGDLDLDIVLVSRNAASKLWINDGAGVYTNVAFPVDGPSYSFDFGDINGDGDLDLVSAEGPGADKLFSNDGTGVYTNISSEIGGNVSADDNDSKFFDYDNDGDLDFIIGSLASVERIFRNNGPNPGTDFTQVTGLITVIGDSTLDIEVADLTGDGKLDIFTAQGESGVNFFDRIYVNVGNDTVIDNRAPRVILTDDLPDTTELGPFVVRTVIYDDYTSDRGFFDKGVFLNYSVDGGSVQSVEMDWHGNSMWRGEIPVQKGPGTVEYYVTATDWNNNLGTETPTHSFVIEPEVTPCTGDISPPEGDGTVNVSDMLALIGVWGACADPANCPADISPEGGDDTVNVADLLAMIGLWGACP